MKSFMEYVDKEDGNDDSGVVDDQLEKLSAVTKSAASKYPGMMLAALRKIASQDESGEIGEALRGIEERGIDDLRRSAALPKGDPHRDADVIVPAGPDAPGSEGMD